MAGDGTGSGQRWDKKCPDVGQEVPRCGTGSAQRWDRKWPEMGQEVARCGTGSGQRWNKTKLNARFQKVLELSDHSFLITNERQGGA